MIEPSKIQLNDHVILACDPVKPRLPHGSSVVKEDLRQVQPLAVIFRLFIMVFKMGKWMETIRSVGDSRQFVNEDYLD